MDSFKKCFADAKRILIFTGAGISAESGVPTFRGSGGLWKKYDVKQLANHDAFIRNPALIWEFYNYRRGVALNAKPNKAHLAITEAQERFAKEGRVINVVTQNVDGLHQKAGTKNVIELHGSLLRTKCMECEHVEENYNHPICEALRDRGAPDVSNQDFIHEDKLPHCNRTNCAGMLRPDVVWFGEHIPHYVMNDVEIASEDVDLGIVVGTSNTIHPAISLLLRLVKAGVPVAEFNVGETYHTNEFEYHFRGPCTETLPEALAP